MSATRRAAADEAATLLAESLRDTVSGFVRVVRQRTGTHNTAQADVLSQLCGGGPASIAALAESRGVTHQSMRLVVARLEEHGLVERAVDPADRRSWMVSATAQGRAEVERDRRERARWLAQAIEARLSASEQAQLPALLGLLRKLVDEAS